MAGKPMKILAACPWPFRPLSGADLSASFGEGMPVFMACNINAKHVDCNARLITRWRIPLRDYANEDSCLIFGPGYS
jgi:hypothetical protein